ncbi:MAG: hypothetical protein ABN502_07475, partial [Gammaproteobacteria bacterium]
PLAPRTRSKAAGAKAGVLDQPFGCCEALLSLRGTSLCRALRAASPCGAAPAARVHKQRKVTRRKAKAFLHARKAEAKAKQRP